MQQTFPAGTAQKIAIFDINGDVFIHGWEQQTIEVSSDGRIGQLQPEGDTLIIRHCNDNIELKVPVETVIGGKNIRGGVVIENVRQVEIDVIGGDVSIKKISSNVSLTKIEGDATLTSLGGDLNLNTIAGSLAVRQVAFACIRGRVQDDATFSEVERVDVERVDGDLVLEDSGEVTVKMVSGDLYAKRGIAVLHAGSVGGDCHVQGAGNAEVQIQNVGNDLVLNGVAHFTVSNVGNDCLVQESASAEGIIGNVGDDLKVIGVAKLQVGNVGSDCEVRDVQGNLSLGHVGSDATISGVAGDLRVGNIGADASLRGITGSISAGNIGSDLHLQAAFPANSEVRLTVGCDARIILPEHASVSIRARVGGDVHGHGIVSNFAGNFVNLVYGDGTARLELNVGNDLELQSSEGPQSSSSMGGKASGWSNFGHNWGGLGHDFEREMGDLGREMEQLGRSLSQDINAAVQEATSSIGSNVTSNIAEAKERVRQQRAAEEQRRAQDRERRQAERERHRASAHDPYFNVRIKDREWQMAPERLENIIDRARKATADGILGALDAVEQAMQNIRINVPHTPSTPQDPHVPHAPHAPQEPNDVDDLSPSSTVTDEPASSVGERSADTSAGKGASLDQEREAILRMIAEGRISPEEGDLLLEALG